MSDTPRKDRVEAVRHALARQFATGRSDVMLRVAFNNARARGGDGNRLVFPSPTLGFAWRYHLRLRPWCYPDPNPFPRFNLFGGRR